MFTNYVHYLIYNQCYKFSKVNKVLAYIIVNYKTDLQQCYFLIGIIVKDDLPASSLLDSKSHFEQPMKYIKLPAKDKCQQNMYVVVFVGQFLSPTLFYRKVGDNWRKYLYARTMSIIWGIEDLPIISKRLQSKMIFFVVCVRSDQYPNSGPDKSPLRLKADRAKPRK